MEKLETVSYGETALVDALLAVRLITYYNTDQYQHWDELRVYSDA